ncbi:MAG TPA: GrpB family protein [Pseudonocardiaceae bacterium]|nr:GrpB family protein [Pseudonocardiaceae bacterium]
MLPIAIMAGPGAERAAELLREQGNGLVDVTVTGRPGAIGTGSGAGRVANVTVTGQPGVIGIGGGNGEIPDVTITGRPSALGIDSGASEIPDVTVTGRPRVAGLVIGVGGGDEDAVDVVLEPSAGAVARLWTERIGPFARRLAGLERAGSAPAALLPHDPALLTAARRLLRRIGDGLDDEGLDDGSWTYDHIGSTAVPGIRAKRFVDLQLGVDPLPEAGSAFDRVLLDAGYQPATGARPDSPGVYRDLEREPGLAPADAYRKRLYFRPDPGLPSILHVRPLGGPWWSYTVLFRDWLRVDPDARTAYEAMKLDAAAAHADDADYDDYTRAKTAFFDRAQAEFERLGRTSPYRVRR